MKKRKSFINSLEQLANWSRIKLIKESESTKKKSLISDSPPPKAAKRKSKANKEIAGDKTNITYNHKDHELVEQNIELKEESNPEESSSDD